VKSEQSKNRKRRVLLITGTPGTGKTTISKRIAEELDADYISVTGLVKRFRLEASFDTERHTKVVDLTRTRAKLREQLQRKEGWVVVDTHVPDCLPKELIRRVVVLRCHPGILERRLRAKAWSTRKIQENVLAELLDSCLMVAVDYYGSKRIVQLDNSNWNIRKSTAAVKALLLQPTRSRIRVDWIGTLESQRRLAKHLV